MRNSLATLLAILSLGATAVAHDGGFGHSRRTLYVTSAPGEFLLEYRIIQTADIALVEMTLIDSDGDGKISRNEQENYFTTALQNLAQRLKCTTLKNVPVEVQPVSYELRQGLGQVFRFRIPTRETDLILTDRAFPHKPGVVRVLTGPHVKAEVHGKVDLTHAEQVSVRFQRLEDRDTNQR